jgi:hypothetical protein
VYLCPDASGRRVRECSDDEALVLVGAIKCGALRRLPLWPRVGMQLCRLSTPPALTLRHEIVRSA